MSEWRDRSVLEAASWRLASELVRRHPTTVRLIHGRPGGGQSDVLWLLSTDGNPSMAGKGDVRLNRDGTIQVLSRFDGRAADWKPVEWDTYLRADPRDFLHQLETAAGLPVPAEVPASTPGTLTLRVLAAIAATAVKSVHPVEIQPGYFDSAGYDGGRNDEAFESFPAIPRDLLAARDDDLFGEPGYRFWFVLRDESPVLAFEQDLGLAWTGHHDNAWDLMEMYAESRRHLLVTALKLFRRVGDV